jgi:LacI family transcriptional regulator
MTKKSASCSLNDISRQLGVSAMTVSRVINNSGPVSAETRERVEQALRASGFKKDRFASINARKRGVRGRQRSVVVDAVVEADAEIDTFDFYSRIVLSTIRRLESAGCHIVLTDLTRQPDMRNDAVAEADAIVFCSPVSEQVRQRIDALNPSIIRVAAFQGQRGASLVGPDDAGGGAMVAELAARGGHGRVAVLTAAHDSYAVRTAAFVSRLQVLSPSARIDVLDYPLLADGIHSDETGIVGLLERYWVAGPQPSLLFAVGGFGTLMLHRFLRGRRIDVPGQVSLIGFDALPFYDHLDIPISRIEFSVGEVGTRLAEEALRRLMADGNGEEARILLPCRYVEGRSFIDVSAMDPTRGSAHAP